MSLEKATFAAGCFWCTETIFKMLRGVKKVISGYSGGVIVNPSYELVSSGSSGHAEAIQITFDSNIISYDDLLYIFWRIHDPTTINKQGHDVGEQYRSVIFYHDDVQKAMAIKSKNHIEKEHLYKDHIVTEIIPFKAFYSAEEYHNNYYSKNLNNQYCRLVIDPKIQKLKRDYRKYLKE